MNSPRPEASGSASAQVRRGAANSLSQRLRSWAAVLQRLVPGLWAGMLLCIALIATPAAFATLPSAEAGKVVAHVFAHEAPISLLLAAGLLVLSRSGAAYKRQPGVGRASQVHAGFLLPAGAAFCTVLGYYGLQPMMVEAKAGLGAWSFGQLHAVSLCLYLLKLLMVLVLAWRVNQEGPVGPMQGG